MPALVFPSSPTLGQIYVATNNVAYAWTGDRWSSESPIHNGEAVYTILGGQADLSYYNTVDNTIDGGGAYTL
jgi:hypothetical protein